MIVVRYLSRCWKRFLVFLLSMRVIDVGEETNYETNRVQTNLPNIDDLRYRNKTNWNDPYLREPKVGDRMLIGIPGTVTKYFPSYDHIYSWLLLLWLSVERPLVDKLLPVNADCWIYAPIAIKLLSRCWSSLFRRSLNGLDFVVAGVNCCGVVFSARILRTYQTDTQPIGFDVLKKSRSFGVENQGYFRNLPKISAAD